MNMSNEYDKYKILRKYRVSFVETWEQIIYISYSRQVFYLGD